MFSTSCCFRFSVSLSLFPVGRSVLERNMGMKDAFLCTHHVVHRYICFPVDPSFCLQISPHLASRKFSCTRWGGWFALLAGLFPGHHAFSPSCHHLSAIVLFPGSLASFPIASSFPLTDVWRCQCPPGVTHLCAHWLGAQDGPRFQG
jgi:hypothetical protein